MKLRDFFMGKKVEKGKKVNPADYQLSQMTTDKELKDFEKSYQGNTAMTAYHWKLLKDKIAKRRKELKL